MSTDNFAQIIRAFEIMFSKLNDHFFEGKLPKALITVSPDTTRGSYGWCTSEKVWKDQAVDSNSVEEDNAESSARYEINMCSEYINRPTAEMAETMLHEMVHLYNCVENIKDTSRYGYYHNEKFKIAAEKHGLSAKKTSKHGYSETFLTEEALEFVQNNIEFENTLFRERKVKKPETSKDTSRLKFFCPGCQRVIYGSVRTNAICGDCKMYFERARK